jgi:hypothetical protein
MPFYFFPAGVNVKAKTHSILNYIDWLVDAHEEARNTTDRNKSFYQRAVYTWQNYLRY